MIAFPEDPMSNKPHLTMPKPSKMLSCSKCSRLFIPERIAEAQLRGADLAEPIRILFRSRDGSAGTMVNGGGGCPRCLTVPMIASAFAPALVQYIPKAWTTMHVLWQNGREMLPPATRQELGFPDPIEPREVMVDGAFSIMAMDEPGAGGANHEYVVLQKRTNDKGEAIAPLLLADIRFQRGGAQEPGHQPGVHNEHLLAVLIDRVKAFQGGPFPSPWNQQALDALVHAQGCLAARTAERQGRGVEGQATP